jgi:phage FluMu protein Com
VTLIVDHRGNNAALECTECHKVFIVSAHIDKTGRVCPHCGEVRAYYNDKDRSAVMHKVRKGEHD